MKNILNDIADEIDLLTAIGPVEYIKDKIFDIGCTIEDALRYDDEAGSDDGFIDTGDINGAMYETDEEDLLTEANEFINGHMSEIREIIIRTIKQVSPSGYLDQQSYLSDVFARAADACWAYIQDIFNDPGISPELSAKITERMIKDTAVVVAMTMFIEWALTQKPDGNDDNGIYKEEVKT